LGLGFLLGNEDGKEKGPEKIKLLERIWISKKEHETVFNKM
jgi:hypothetical protein